MPGKDDKDVVKHGDVSQRVGVEVIRARGVDVEKLIKMLIANAAAEFASTITTTPFSACTWPVTKITKRFAKTPVWKIALTGN